MKQTVLFVSLLVLLTSCSPPPDVPMCRALANKIMSHDVEGIGRIVVEVPNPVCMREINEPVCGYCVWTVSDKDKYVGEAESHRLEGEPWSKIKLSSILAPASSYAKMKSYLINQCERHNDCAKDINKWRTKFDSLDKIEVLQ